MAGWMGTRLTVGTSLGVAALSLVGWGVAQAASEPTSTVSSVSQVVLSDEEVASGCETSSDSTDTTEPDPGATTSTPTPTPSPSGGAASTSTGTVVDVNRFWSPGFGNAHFFTSSQTETNHIIATDSNWTYEGRAFSAYDAAGGCASGTVEVYRFYSAVFQTHFFTASSAERDAISSSDRNWSYEGVAYCAPAASSAGSTPLYRFWSPAFSKHFYTASAAEKDSLVANDRNWVYEGVAYSVLP